MLASIPGLCGRLGGGDEAGGTWALPTGRPAGDGLAAPEDEGIATEAGIGGDEEYWRAAP